jgi:hypothetical protein
MDRGREHDLLGCGGPDPQPPGACIEKKGEMASLDTLQKSDFF